MLWQIHNHGFDSDDSHETAIVHSHRSGVHISIGGSDDASSDAPAAPAAPAPPAHVTHVRSLHDLNFAVPLGVLFGIAGFVAIGFATILGTSLNKENTLGGFAFTKPISRERLALTYFAVDAGGIVAMFLYVVLFEFIELAILGIGDRVVVDPNAFAVLAIGLGAAAMWYGLLQAVTSALRFPGGMFIGIGWGVFITLIPLSLFMGFGPVFHALVMALNYLNPLAYYSGLDMSRRRRIDRVRCSRSPKGPASRSRGA